MGLFEQALITYHNSKDKVGKYFDGKEALAPVGHILAQPGLEITIDQEGRYVRAQRISKDFGKVIIPVTESSAGRSSGIAPHPLCEQIKYLAAYDGKSEERQKLYLAQLDRWRKSPYSLKALDAIYAYVSGNTILADLARDNLVKLDEKGMPEDDKLLTIWNVLGVGDDSRVWCSTELMDSYSRFYIDSINDINQHNICAMTGENTVTAHQHLKGVFSNNGNAKLISSNDNTNFTFRGRFLTDKEALTVGYAASQKAHNALKWLVANEGVVIGNREYLCWSPQRDRIPGPESSLLKAFFADDLPETPDLPSYQTALKKALWGYASNIRDKNSSTTVMACFDAATAGRLAVTFYAEGRTQEYLSRLENWDSTCCWYGYKGNIQSPSLYKIALYAYGIERTDTHGKSRVEADDKIIKGLIEQLLYSRIGKGLFPTNIYRKLIVNASNLLRYEKGNRNELLSIACAVICKYHADYQKETMCMELNEERKDRSYQFGRLLAIYEKIERDTYDRESAEGREPNALRLQSVYCNQPMHYAFELEKQLERAYFPRLKESAGSFYKRLIGDIMGQINEFPENEWNRPLSDSYLMGYYLQRKKLYTSHKNNIPCVEEVEQ